MSNGRTARRAIWSVTLLVAVFGIARLADSLPEGLMATYFSDTAWTSGPVRTVVESAPATDRIFTTWRGSPPEAFSTTWTGSIAAVRGGIYTFSTTSDDGSWLYVDGRLVVDNGGGHSSRRVAGTIDLAAGVHTILLKYFQSGGPLELELAWARDGAAAEPVPSWALTPEPVTYPRFMVSLLIRRAWVITWWLWLATAGAVAAAALWRRVSAAGMSVDLGLAGLGVVLLTFVLPHEISSDGRARFFALAQIIEWHEMPTTAYSMIGPLCSAPLYFLGRLIATPEWWCARFNLVVFAGGLLIASALVRDRVPREARTKWLLILLAASMFPIHVEGYFGEVFTAVLAGVGLLAVREGYTVAGWSAAVVGVANTPASIVGLAGAAAIQAWDTRRLRHLLPVAAAAAMIAAESWIRRGSPLITGYEGNHGATTLLTYSGRPGFSYPLFFGLLSVLFSFGKGLAFYAPGLLLSVRQRLDGYRLWVAFLAGLVLVYAKWWAWFGGLFFGPRFFLFASIPASFALATWLVAVREAGAARLAAALAALTLSAWVAIAGVAFNQSAIDVCRDWSLEWTCFYVPEFSPLWRPFVEWTTPTGPRATVAAYFCLVYARLASPPALALARRASAGVAMFVDRTGDLASWRF